MNERNSKKDKFKNFKQKKLQVEIVYSKEGNSIEECLFNIFKDKHKGV